PTPPYSVTWNTTTASPGTHVLSARARDAAGNTQTSSTVSVTVNNTVDTQPPTGTIVINGNAAATNSRTATLTLSATDTQGAVTQMRFSNTGRSFSTAEGYATTKTWTLTNGAGTKTVYVQFRDAAGNWSGSFTDSIVLDTTAPTISSVAASGITGRSAHRLWDHQRAVDVAGGVRAHHGVRLFHPARLHPGEQPRGHRQWALSGDHLPVPGPVDDRRGERAGRKQQHLHHGRRSGHRPPEHADRARRGRGFTDAGQPELERRHGQRGSHRIHRVPERPFE